MERLLKKPGPSLAHACNLQGACAVEAACSGDNMDLLRTLMVEGNLDTRSKFREGTALYFAPANETPWVEEVVRRYMN